MPNMLRAEPKETRTSQSKIIAEEVTWEKKYIFVISLPIVPYATVTTGESWNVWRHKGSIIR